MNNSTLAIISPKLAIANSNLLSAIHTNITQNTLSKHNPWPFASSTEAKRYFPKHTPQSQPESFGTRRNQLPWILHLWEKGLAAVASTLSKRCCLPVTAPAQQEIEKRYPPNYGANNPWIIHIRRRSSHRHTYTPTDRQTIARLPIYDGELLQSRRIMMSPRGGDSRHSRLDYNNGRRGWLLPPMNDGSKTTRRTNLDGKMAQKTTTQEELTGCGTTEAHLTKNWWSSSVFFPCVLPFLPQFQF